MRQIVRRSVIWLKINSIFFQLRFSLPLLWRNSLFKLSQIICDMFANVAIVVQCRIPFVQSVYNSFVEANMCGFPLCKFALRFPSVGRKRFNFAVLFCFPCFMFTYLWKKYVFGYIVVVQSVVVSTNLLLYEKKFEYIFYDRARYLDVDRGNRSVFCAEPRGRCKKVIIFFYCDVETEFVKSFDTSPCLTNSLCVVVGQDLGRVASPLHTCTRGRI